MYFKRMHEDQISRAAENIRNADSVIIGAGAGASTAAGIQYGGKRFTDNFTGFAKKYSAHYMTDMYAAGFYPYPSEEAKWGYWSKHALMNRFDPMALPLYIELYDIVKNKEYFVLTTNVEHQFYKAGFDEKEYLQHRETMEKSVSEAVIPRLTMQKTCFVKWMKQEETA